MIEPLTIILLALVGLCLVVMWGYIHRVRLRQDFIEREFIKLTRKNASLRNWRAPEFTDISGLKRRRGVK